MTENTPIGNPNAAPVDGVFSWGLKVKQPCEWYYISGHGDVNNQWQVGHPGDPLGQTRAVFGELVGMIDRAGYKLSDVVKVEITVTKQYNLAENFPGFIGIFAETFKDVAVKPSVGTLRVVEELVVPGMLVEIEMLAAR